MDRAPSGTRTFNLSSIRAQSCRVSDHNWTSVGSLKDTLKIDNRSRLPSSLDAPVSCLKEHLFTSSTTLTQQGGWQDATVYKHEDIEPPGGFYQPHSRHVDRSAGRSRADNATPASSDITSMKRKLLGVQKLLDDSLVRA